MQELFTIIVLIAAVYVAMRERRRSRQQILNARLILAEIDRREQLRAHLWNTTPIYRD